MKRIITLIAATVVAATAALAVAVNDPWQSTAKYEFEYRVPLAGVAPEGSHLALWVPYPVESDVQKILDVKITAPFRWKVAQEKKYGNNIVYTEGRMPSSPADFVMTVQVERKPYRGIQVAQIDEKSAANPGLYRGADKLIPLDGEISRIATEKSQGLTSKQQKIRAFYDYVYETMTYNKDGTGWGRGDAIWACTNKRGNCTDFHSLLIGMARSQEIPARFFIGFPIPETDDGEIGGYHCWAELYDEERGWIPVDASEAKKRGLKDAYFGALPNDRIEFSLGRDLTLEPPQKGEALNYFIYPYAEVDEKPVPELKKDFHFRRMATS